MSGDCRRSVAEPEGVRSINKFVLWCRSEETMADLIQRLERATSGEFQEDYSAQDYLNLCHEALAALKSAAADEADAERMRWLLAGNGYFMEEEMLCGHGPCSQDEQDDARRKIDAAMLDCD